MTPWAELGGTEPQRWSLNSDVCPNHDLLTSPSGLTQTPHEPGLLVSP